MKLIHLFNYSTIFILYVLLFFEKADLLSLIQNDEVGGGAGDQLIVSKPTSIALVNINTLRSKELIDSLSVTPLWIGLFDNNYIFYPGSNTHSIDEVTIKAYDLITRDTRDLLGSSVTFIHSLAVDWLTHKLYWTNKEELSIEIIDFEKPSSRTVLFSQNLDGLNAIAVEPVSKYLFWTRTNKLFTIERSGLDGSTRQIIYTDESESKLSNHRLVVDPNYSRLYWINTEKRGYASIDFNGNDYQFIEFDASKLITPVDLAVSPTRIYFAHGTSISSVEKGKGQLIHAKTYAHQILTIHIASFNSLSLNGVPNPCFPSNAGCSHLCLLTPLTKKVSCLCPTGVLISPDNVTCPDHPGRLLLLARSRGLFWIPLDTPHRVFLPILLFPRNTANPVRLDFDPVNRTVYWVDNMQRTVNRVQLSGRDSQVLHVSAGDPVGISVDYISRHLYWSLAKSREVWVSKLDGTMARPLLLPPAKRSSKDQTDGEATQTQSGDGEALPVAVDPVNRLLFWNINSGGKAAIEMGWLDGTNRRTLVSDVVWPNGLSVNPLEKRVYFAEAMHKFMGSVSYQGGDVTKFLTKVDHPFGFTILGDAVYWTTWNAMVIKRTSISIPVVSIFHRNPGRDFLTGIKAVDLNRYPTDSQNPCSIVAHNGGCSHLCFPKPLPLPLGSSTPHRSCLCPPNQDLDETGRVCRTHNEFLFYTTGAAITSVGLDKAGLPYKKPLSSSTKKSLKWEPLPLIGLKHVTKMEIGYRLGRLFWIDNELKTISWSYINGTAQSTLVSSGLSLVESLALDWLADNLFFINMPEHQMWARIEVVSLASATSAYQGREQSWIRRAPLPRKVVMRKGLVSPKGLVVHPLQKIMLWFNTLTSGKFRLFSAGLDGSDPTLLYSGNGEIGAVTFDYQDGHGRLYWFNSAEQVIETYLIKSGPGYKLSLNPDVIPLSMDVISDYLYFSNMMTSSIHRIAKRPPSPPSMSITSLVLPPLTSLPLHFLLHHPGRQPSALPPPTAHPCATHPPHDVKATLEGVEVVVRPPCPQICLERPDPDATSNPMGLFQCGCPSHYSLNRDMTCDPPKSYILVLRSSGTLVRILPPSSSFAPDIILPTHFSNSLNNKKKSIKSAAWDSVSNAGFYFVPLPPVNSTQTTASSMSSDTVYWLDIATGVSTVVIGQDSTSNDIVSSSKRKNDSPHLKRSSRILYSPSTAHSIALEPVSRLLFWTDPDAALIIAASLNSKTILGPVFNSTKMAWRPLSLTVNSLTGSLYWIGALKKPNTAEWFEFRIETCLLSGENHRVVLESGAVAHPRDLIVDAKTNYLFWIDVKKRRIERFRDSLNKENSHQVVIHSDITESAHSLTLLSGYLYWLDTTLKRVSLSGSKVESIPSLDFVSGHPVIALFSVYSDPVMRSSELGDLTKNHPCLRSPCSHLCLPLPTSVTLYRCACPIGFSLDTLRQSHCSPDYPCLAHQYLCPTGLAPQISLHNVPSNGCIPNSMKCDGIVHCKDGSDEVNCPHCNTRNSYRCGNGQCISGHHRCDNIAHCDTDELCCKLEEFQCPYTPYFPHTSLRCLSTSVMCNGKSDCVDSADENHCELLVAPHLEVADTSRTTYIIVITIAVLAVITALGVAGYKSTKRRHGRPYIIGAEQVDIMLLPSDRHHPESNSPCYTNQSQGDTIPSYANQSHTDIIAETVCGPSLTSRESQKYVTKAVKPGSKHSHNKTSKSSSSTTYLPGPRIRLIAGPPSPTNTPSYPSLQPSLYLCSQCHSHSPGHRHSNSQQLEEHRNFHSDSHRQQPITINYAVYGPTSGAGSSILLYDRDRLTGTSSSNSGVNIPQGCHHSSTLKSNATDSYPQETLNPPPSPITEVSCDHDTCCTPGQDFSSWWHQYRAVDAASPPLLPPPPGLQHGAAHSEEQRGLHGATGHKRVSHKRRTNRQHRRSRHPVSRHRHSLCPPAPPTSVHTADSGSLLSLLPPPPPPIDTDRANKEMSPQLDTSPH